MTAKRKTTRKPAQRKARAPRQAALELTDFDATGLETVIHMLFTKHVDGDYIFRADGRGGTDVPLAGVVAFDTASVLNGIRLINTNNIRLHDAGPTDLHDYFDSGAGADQSLYTQTEPDAEPLSFTVADEFTSGGGGWANFTSIPAAFYNLWNDLADGERIIFVTGRPTILPALPTIPDVLGSPGVAGSYVFPEATAGLPAPTYSLQGTLPAGATFDATTQTLTWTAAIEKGQTALIYRARNSAGTADAPFSFVVGGAVNVGGAWWATQGGEYY